ncbi:MAG TPA: DUF2085 domain-containing protein [Vicinamibacterales bacterium]|nr:DUF2085 domain-containing protein [Vicinamibacterales bacterium]HOQ62149.1 DUF2085 domain-containing protein [Vicinamibacterales bacterium]HPK72677.1 DUF2085 domain-containing protein [Vicinamibacterales bacterium]
MKRLPLLLVWALAVCWAAWLAAVPALAASSPRGAILWAVAATYQAGGIICHQRDTRSFHVAGVRMPVCSRCAGLYVGAAAGASAVIAWAGTVGGRPRRRVPLRALRAAVAASAAPTLAAWLAEHAAGVWVPDLARALAALPLGAAVAALIALWAGGASFDDAAGSEVD